MSVTSDIMLLCCINRVHHKAVITVLSHHWADLLSHRPAPSSCPARAQEPPAACGEEWSPHHPAVKGSTQM